MKNDPELEEVLYQAEIIANSSGKNLNSAYILLSLLKEDTIARDILNEAGIYYHNIIRHIEILNNEEPLQIYENITQKARQSAFLSKSNSITTLHFLSALIETKNSLARIIIEKSGADIDNIRNRIYLLLKKSSSPDLSYYHPQLFPSRFNNNEKLMMDNLTTYSDRNLSIKASLYRKKNVLESDEKFLKYALSNSEYPCLSSLGRNLNLLACEGKLDPVIGRNQEINALIDILNKRKANNPCLVGEPGVGKTAIVEGLARKIVESPYEVPGMENKIIIELSTSALLAGTQLRGSFSNKMMEIKKEVKKSNGRIIIFIDELHTLVGAGSTSESNHDAIDELKSALAHAEFPCIGTTTPSDYKKYIETDQGLERRFQFIKVKEPTIEEAIDIVSSIIPYYEAHHGVNYSYKAIEWAVKLSARYIQERYLPDKALNIIDIAGSRVKRYGMPLVTEADIAQVVSELSNIPQNLIIMSDAQRFLNMEKEMGKYIIGHEKIISKIASVIRRHYAGFSSERPIGVFLFLGPTGVGKTESARVLAQFLFNNKNSLIRVDMSEYMESHSVARLIGSPPGYIGFEQGGQLTEALRKNPHQIILLDEIEKANREVLQIFLQVFDSGRLTDGHGRTVDFSNTVIIMTSNLGSDKFSTLNKKIGFLNNNDKISLFNETEKEVLDIAKKTFPIELWNRIDEKVVFHQLTAEQVKKIAYLQIKESSDTLLKNTEISYIVKPEVIDYLIEIGGYSLEFGARPMRRTIQEKIEQPLSEKILNNEFKQGDKIEVYLLDNKISFKKVKSFMPIST